MKNGILSMGLRIALIFMVVLSLPSYAAGLKFDGARSDSESKARYDKRFDTRFGWLIIDNANLVEFAKCPVGMEALINKETCSGTPDLLTYDQAVGFSKRIREGWRLANVDELISYAESNYDFKQLLIRLSGDGYRYYWTSGVAEYRGIGRGATTMVVVETGTGWNFLDRNENATDKYPVILVRSKTKAPAVAIPPNAEKEPYATRGWRCKTGFEQVEDRCVRSQ